MNSIFYQIGRPFSYLTIQHEEKHVYDWVIPTIATLLTQLYILFVLGSDIEFSLRDLISDLVGFVEVLPGFFIAALAAVATFNNPQIDQIMNKPPRIRLDYYGKLVLVDMTRRRFLCVLFAYLTAISISLIVITRLTLETPSILNYPHLTFSLAVLASSVFFMFFWQMIVATLLGLFYLGERLHTPYDDKSDDSA